MLIGKMILLEGMTPTAQARERLNLLLPHIGKVISVPGKQNSMVSLSSARAGNIIGGGDWAEDRIFPDCIRALVKEKPVEIRNPHAIRPWQFVLDPLFGYLLLALKMKDRPGSICRCMEFWSISFEFNRGSNPYGKNSSGMGKRDTGSKCLKMKMPLMKQVILCWILQNR